MTTVRDGIEQAVLISIGTAAITRERAEAAVAELVRRGQIGADEGKRAVDRLMETVRGGEGSPADGLVHRIEGGVQGVLRGVGVITRSEFDDLRQRLTELQHRVELLEGGDAPAAAADGDDAADASPEQPTD